MSAETIDQISLDAWNSVGTFVKAYAKRIYDVDIREEVIQQATVLFIQRYSKRLLNQDDFVFDYSEKDTRNLSKSCLFDAAEKLGCYVKESRSHTKMHLCNLDEIAEMPAPSNFYQSPMEKALADKVNFIIEFANSQSDKHFADICALLYQEFNQKEIAQRLGLSPATVNDLIRKNRNQLLPLLAARGGC